MSRVREREPFTVYKGRRGIMTKTFDVIGRPLDEVPVNEEGEVDISSLNDEIARAKEKRPPLDSVPYKRHKS